MEMQKADLLTTIGSSRFTTKSSIELLESASLRSFMSTPTHYYIGSSSIQVLYKGTLIKNASAVLCCSRSLLEVAKNYFTTVLGFLSSRLLPF